MSGLGRALVEGLLRAFERGAWKGRNGDPHGEHGAERLHDPALRDDPDVDEPRDWPPGRPPRGPWSMG